MKTEKIENESTDKREDFSRFDDDDCAFVPVENIRIIQRVMDNLEEVKQRLKELKPVELNR